MIKSFGFSVSDGAGENPGVFINAILPGGPADRCGMVKPLDKILQVQFWWAIYTHTITCHTFQYLRASFLKKIERYDKRWCIK